MQRRFPQFPNAGKIGGSVFCRLAYALHSRGACALLHFVHAWDAIVAVAADADEPVPRALVDPSGVQNPAKQAAGGEEGTGLKDPSENAFVEWR